MKRRIVVLWEGPGEYTPVLTARRGWFVWTRVHGLLDAIASVRLYDECHAARLGRVIVAKGEPA